MSSKKGESEVAHIGGKSYQISPGNGYVQQLGANGGVGDSVIVNQTINASEGVGVDQLMQAMSPSKDQAIGAIRESLLRGG